MAESKVNPTEEEFSYFCDHCKKGFKRKRLSFISISSLQEEFTCIKCEIAFANGFKLKKSDFPVSYPHSCEVCGMRFQTSTLLLYHSYYHTGAWPFKCPFCRMGFPIKSCFERHFTTKTIKCCKYSEAYLRKFCSAPSFFENDELNCEKCSSGSKCV
ncbi:hypothetical protein TNCT_222461 [Trichonephila clavata]|uniref:C2H2-type domain-containing protein n=1 Tax=Trichonephila clavata TaxID=2740835 RepID=A0A8X6FCN6_TRICU|nr:hypothetical protein TNCT_222461 [Trichonephila clavata]